MSTIRGAKVVGQTCLVLDDGNFGTLCQFQGGIRAVSHKQSNTDLGHDPICVDNEDDLTNAQ